MTKYALITDFDGTITTKDIGNALCIHYGLTSPEKIEKAYNIKADAREWMKNHFGSVKTTKEEFEKIILEKALVRHGFRDLCLYAKKHDIPFEIASGGLDIYIKPVLEAFDCTQIKIGSVKGVIRPEGIEVLTKNSFLGRRSAYPAYGTYCLRQLSEYHRLSGLSSTLIDCSSSQRLLSRPGPGWWSG